MIETRRLKNVVIFIQTILRFVLSRKKFQNWISIFSKLNSISELFSIAFTDLYYESYQDLLSYSTEGRNNKTFLLSYISRKGLRLMVKLIKLNLGCKKTLHISQYYPIVTWSPLTWKFTLSFILKGITYCYANRNRNFYKYSFWNITQ